MAANMEADVEKSIDGEQKQPNCVFTFKKRVLNKGGRNSRKREQSGDEKDSSGDDTIVVKKERKQNTANPMMQKTNKLKKNIDQYDTHHGSDEEKKGNNVSVSFKSSRTAEREGPGDMGATSVLEIETEKDRDAQAIFERAQAVNKERKGKEEDNKYRGLNNYSQYYEKRDTAQGNASSGMVRKGPIRAPENLRATVRWDYQPDICKDYKETGFCGFGDSCKFMHDRSDYKHGWQLEREVEENMYKEEDASRYEIAAEEDEVPFKCYICRKSFKDPIVTKCKHYFCEKCALEHYKKSQRCYVCGTQTAGVFNTAKDVLAKMKDASAADSSDSNSEDSSNDDE